MNKLNPNLIAGGVILLLSMAFYRGPDMITAWKGAPETTPIQESDLADKVAENFSGPKKDACEMIAHYEAKIAILESEAPISTTAEFLEIDKRARLWKYKKLKPWGDRHAELAKIVVGEQVRRGLIEGDKDGDGDADKALPLDRPGFVQFYKEIIEGLSR